VIRTLLAYLRGHLWLRRRARMSPEEQRSAIVAHLEEHQRRVERDAAIAARYGGVKIACVDCGWQSTDFDMIRSAVCPHCSTAAFQDSHATHVAAHRRVM
jgi:predicted Zn-ribbon and HTH transcriptional regulator